MLEKTAPWITPFRKQCFVVSGVALTMGQMGLVMGFSSRLLPQLKMEHSAIPIDDETGSWIASMPAISIMVGNLMIPYIMGKFGRKIAYYTALILSIIGWIGIVLSTKVIHLLCARCLQGIAMGTITTLGPLLVGEYSSPIYRGSFLMSLSLIIGFGVFSIHTMGSYLSWKTTALICIALTIMDLLFAITSPESPSWLAAQGRYEECKAAFRWLRGDSEEEELEKMIESSEIAIKDAEKAKDSTQTVVKKVRESVKFFGQTVKTNEFYKPFIIMIHIYAMAQWSGVNLLASYAVDFIQTVVGGDIDLPLMIMSLDIQRIISNGIALIVIKKMKRRMMIFLSVGLNVATLLVIAAFTFAKENDLNPFDENQSYYIGIGLVHFLTFTIAVGALPMCFILAGELFPLKYKSMAGGVSCLFFSINLFINLKTVPFLLSTINVYGLYVLYCILLVYFLVVVGVMLPETKDKTLQDIEEEFKGKKKPVIVTEKFTTNPEV